MSRYVPTTDDVKTNYVFSMYAHNKDDAQALADLLNTEDKKEGRND